MIYPVDIAYLVFIFITLYFTILYFLLFLRNKKLIKRIPKLTKHPSVSIIIPAYNEENVIGKTVKNLKKLIYPKNKLEIIVVNDGSSDKTGQIARTFKGVKVFDKVNQGKKAYALNFGLKRAKGEIILGLCFFSRYPGLRRRIFIYNVCLPVFKSGIKLNSFRIRKNIDFKVKK